MLFEIFAGAFKLAAMTIKDIFSFSFRLLTAKKGRTLLVIIGVCLGSFLLALFFSFSEGLKQHILKPLEQELQYENLIVLQKEQKDSGILNPLNLLHRDPQNWISPEAVARIQEFPEVAGIEPEIRIPFPIATSAQIILGLRFEFDSTLSGYSEEAVKSYLPKEQTFSGDEDVIPVVLPPLLVEIYNSTIVEMAPGAERKTMDDFLQRELEFTFGRINYLGLLHRFPADTVPQTRKAKIVGFAPFLSPFTMGIPEKVAREMRLAYEDISAEEILPRSLIVKPESVQMIGRLKQELSELGFLVQDFSENLDAVRGLFMSLQSVLLFSAATTLIVAILFLVSVLVMSVLEQRQTIGILQALGASDANIRNIFLFQGASMVLCGIVMGFLAALGIAAWLNELFLNFLPTVAIVVPSVFLFDFYFLLKLFAGLCLIPLVVIFFSVRKTLSLSPLKSILV